MNMEIMIETPYAYLSVPRTPVWQSSGSGRLCQNQCAASGMLTMPALWAWQSPSNTLDSWPCSRPPGPVGPGSTRNGRGEVGGGGGGCSQQPSENQQPTIHQIHSLHLPAPSLPFQAFTCSSRQNHNPCGVWLRGAGGAPWCPVSG